MMKLTLLTTLFLTTTLASTPVFAQEDANNQIRFICSTSRYSENGKSVPTTFLWTPNFQKAMVTWTSVLGGVKPQQRCKIVSQNFQTAFNNGSLNYVTNAFQNGNKVICSVSSIDGGCDTVLFTLRPQDKSRDILKRLNKLWFGSVTADSGHIIEQSQEKKFYIDIRQFLNTPPANKMQ